VSGGVRGGRRTPWGRRKAVRSILVTYQPSCRRAHAAVFTHRLLLFALPCILCAVSFDQTIAVAPHAAGGRSIAERESSDVDMGRIAKRAGCHTLQHGQKVGSSSVRFACKLLPPDACGNRRKEPRKPAKASTATCGSRSRDKCWRYCANARLGLHADPGARVRNAA
jgi:hypothetical protein